jgi:hypothetical protein
VDLAIGLRSSGDVHVPSAAQQTRMTRVVIVVMALVAMALSFYQLTRPNILFGVDEYDDGAYFGSAIRLVHGALPYRDFVLVQPPGFALLTSPLALLSRALGTRETLAAARLCMPLVAALNVALVGVLMRHRGLLATLVAAGLMAVFPAEIRSTHTLLLEPVLNTFCLLGAALVFRGERFRAGTRWMLLGGVAFGFAGSIKGWALVPVLVVVLLCLLHARRRLAPFIGGVVLGFAVPTLPFALTAPGSFYREVVATQLSRLGRSGRIPISTRLGDLTGSSSVTPNGSTSLLVSIGILAVTVALVIAAASRMRRRPTTFELFVIASLVGVAALLMAPSEFYDHYAAFFAPFLTMVIGGSVGLLAVGRRTMRATLVAAAVGVVVLTVNQVRIMGGDRGNNYTSTVGTIIPAGACALSDSADYLITTNRFVSTQPGCADNVTDSYGTTISDGGGQTPAAAATWLHAIADSDYVVLSSSNPDGRIPLVAAVQADLTDHFTLVHAGHLLIYVRHGFAVG